MILFLAAMSSADFTALDIALQQCKREVINPMFAAEAERRSAFMTEAFREQEAIVAERLDIAAKKRAIRAGDPQAKGAETDAQLNARGLNVEDRQRALNDRRMLEGMRVDTMDAKRRYYLARCANGKD
ncbi:hypothetical protein H9L12_10985 [Sphingomonas rhizophila]|uniref:Uncharacterized protein n=1 Tax=Sphingomonas rhizophila TaxID=2071607 RepID=A0A7G9SA92_9SPHN|nr:hypothetical protein [Sphingomonas rhizophila]QNN64767.1 hypothetical protein H9L12_10985 [Sphingomonas rhizophila]